jgi:hypothetical protein
VGLLLVSSENQKQVQGSPVFPHFLQVHPQSPKIEKQPPFILHDGFILTSYVKQIIS